MRRKKLATAITIAAVLGAVMVVGARVALIFYDYPLASRELPEAEREYRKRGLPWVATDLGLEELPLEENAARLLREASEIMVAKGLKRGGLPTEVEGEADRKTARQVIIDWEDPLKLAEKAAKLPKANWERDLDATLHLEFFEYALLKELVSVLRLRALLSSAEGNVSAATDDLARALCVARHISADPLLLALLIHSSLNAIAMKTGEDLLPACRGNSVHLARLKKTLEAEYRPPDFWNALLGEMYYGVASARNISAYGGLRIFSDPHYAPPPLDPSKIQRDGYPRDHISRGHLVRHLQLWTQAHDRLQPHRDNPAKMAEILDEMLAEVERQRGLSHLMNKIVVPVFGQAGQAVAKGKAQYLTLMEMIHALEFEARRGRLPRSFEEMGRSPVDPFDGQPLRMKRTNTEFLIYSVGIDGNDDGGLRLSDPGAGNDKQDIVTAIPLR
jgi:hypothetical protein